jgi:threonine synthase
MERKLYFTGFHCVHCGAVYRPTEDLLLCRKCDNLLEADYDYAALRADFRREDFASRPSGVWRWREFLPVVDDSRIVTLGEGGTPFLRCDRLAAAIGVRELWVKSDATGNPTGSLKDRSITVSATKAVEFGYRVLACDSTGNKASSVAAYAARAGLESVVFCPVDTPLPKMAQAIFFGARLLRVRGHYSQINAMYRRLIHSGAVKWYDCGTDNPFRYEGKKTYAYEIAQSLDWRVPDCVVHPASGGMSIAKTWKGFNELKTLGWTDRLPRMCGVQAANCGPIAASCQRGESTVSAVEKKPTLASALAAADPGLLGNRALAAIQESGGAAAGIAEAEIMESVRLLGSEGIFVEPSGGVTIAGVRAMVRAGQIKPHETVVCVVTGSGFKDFERIAETVEIPKDIVEDYDGMLTMARSI